MEGEGRPEKWKDLQLLIKLKILKIWSYIWEDFSMLYNQIQRKGKFIASCESLTIVAYIYSWRASSMIVLVDIPLIIYKRCCHLSDPVPSIRIPGVGKCLRKVEHIRGHL